MAVSEVKGKDIIRRTYTVTLTNSTGVAPWDKFGTITIDAIDGYIPIACFAKSRNSVNRVLANLYGYTLVVYALSELPTSAVEVLYWKN